MRFQITIRPRSNSVPRDAISKLIISETANAPRKPPRSNRHQQKLHPLLNVTAVDVGPRIAHEHAGIGVAVRKAAHGVRLERLRVSRAMLRAARQAIRELR
jgi:hypothetical protein